jgi:hypothetical protein
MSTTRQHVCYSTTTRKRRIRDEPDFKFQSLHTRRNQKVDLLSVICGYGNDFRLHAAMWNKDRPSQDTWISYAIKQSKLTPTGTPRETIYQRMAAMEARLLTLERHQRSAQATAREVASISSSATTTPTCVHTRRHDVEAPGGGEHICGILQICC